MSILREEQTLPHEPLHLLFMKHKNCRPLCSIITEIVKQTNKKVKNRPVGQGETQKRYTSENKDDYIH